MTISQEFKIKYFYKFRLTLLLYWPSRSYCFSAEVWNSKQECKRVH